jgi:hypothetical protein
MQKLGFEISPSGIGCLVAGHIEAREHGQKAARIREGVHEKEPLL